MLKGVPQGRDPAPRSSGARQKTDYIGYHAGINMKFGRCLDELLGPLPARAAMAPHSHRSQAKAEAVFLSTR